MAFFNDACAFAATALARKRVASRTLPASNGMRMTARSAALCYLYRVAHLLNERL
jgi:hypothetical protein